MDEGGIISRRTEAYGPLVAHHQNVHAAELFAFLFYLRNAVSSEGFYVDCAYVVDGFFNGRYSNTHGWAVDADLWKLVFDKVDDLGADVVRVFKIKAHRNIRNALGPYDRMQIIANNKADALAKLGANLHPDDRDRRLSCYSDARLYAQVVKFSTRCLAYAIDKGLYKDIQ